LAKTPDRSERDCTLKFDGRLEVRSRKWSQLSLERK
jgi:hypothetical protein